MSERDSDIAKVKALTSFNNPAYIFWHEEGGGEVHRIWDTYFLFEIPAYGGEGRFSGSFNLNEVEKLVDLAHTWT